VRRRFGSLVRMPYPVTAEDAEALRTEDLDPAVAYVRARGVPEPVHPEGSIVGVHWHLDDADPCVLVTYWVPR